jgi:hypothetical protein
MMEKNRSLFQLVPSLVRISTQLVYYKPLSNQGFKERYIKKVPSWSEKGANLYSRKSCIDEIFNFCMIKKEPTFFQKGTKIALSWNHVSTKLEPSLKFCSILKLNKGDNP